MANGVHEMIAGEDVRAGELVYIGHDGRYYRGNAGIGRIIHYRGIWRINWLRRLFRKPKYSYPMLGIAITSGAKNESVKVDVSGSTHAY